MPDVLRFPLAAGECHAFALMVRGIRECDRALEIAARAELLRLGIAVAFDESVWGRRPDHALPETGVTVDSALGLSLKQKGPGTATTPFPAPWLKGPSPRFSP